MSRRVAFQIIPAALLLAVGCRSADQFAADSEAPPVVEQQAVADAPAQYEVPPYSAGTPAQNVGYPSQSPSFGNTPSGTRSQPALPVSGLRLQRTCGPGG